MTHSLHSSSLTNRDAQLMMAWQAADTYRARQVL